MIEANDRTQRTVVAQMAGERAGIEVVDAWDPVAAQVVVDALTAAPVAILVAPLAHDQRRDPRTARLDILIRDAIVANQRIGHRHHLPPVGGIGADLLIAGHRRDKDDLTTPPALQRLQRAKRLAVKDRAIFERQRGDQLTHLVFHTYLPPQARSAGCATSSSLAS